MNQKRLTVRYFLLSFAAGFLVLAVAAMLVVLFVPPQMHRDLDTNEYQGAYLPSNEDALNLLVVIERASPEEEDSFLLIRFDPVRGQIPVLALPGRTLLEINNNTLSIDNLYEYAGVKRVSGELADDLGVQIDRYIKMNKQNVIDLIDLLGGVRYRLNAPLTLSSGNVGTTLEAGNQQLSGSLFYEVMTYGGYPDGELGRARVMGELACSLINQHGELILTEESDALFERIVNMVQTDFSAMDYTRIKPAARFLAQLRGEAAISIPITGNSNEQFEIFSLSKTALGQIQEIYSPAQQHV